MSKESRSLQCPNCRGPLTMVLDEGAPVDVCGSCRGIWVEWADEKAVLRIRPQAFSIDELHRLRAKYKPLGKDDPVRMRRCAECGELMYRRNWGSHSGVIVDRCEKHGSWFEQGEIEKVREFIEMGGIEFEKLRVAEQGIMELDAKIDRKVDDLEQRFITYRRARLWGVIGF